jgi:hypothetical protein
VHAAVWLSSLAFLCRNDSTAPGASRHRQQQKAAQGGAAALEHVAGADYQYKAGAAIAEKPSRPRYHAFGLIGAALSKKISVFRSSSPKVVPISPNAP